MNSKRFLTKLVSSTDKVDTIAIADDYYKELNKSMSNDSQPMWIGYDENY